MPSDFVSQSGRLLVRLNSFDVPCRPRQEGPDSSNYANHGDAYNQKYFPSLAHPTPCWNYSRRTIS
jgi:hypothetical protein